MRAFVCGPERICFITRTRAALALAVPSPGCCLGLCAEIFPQLLAGGGEGRQCVGFRSIWASLQSDGCGEITAEGFGFGVDPIPLSLLPARLCWALKPFGCPRRPTPGDDFTALFDSQTEPGLEAAVVGRFCVRVVFFLPECE